METLQNKTYHVYSGNGIFLMENSRETCMSWMVNANLKSPHYVSEVKQHSSKEGSFETQDLIHIHNPNSMALPMEMDIKARKSSILGIRVTETPQA